MLPSTSHSTANGASILTVIVSFLVLAGESSLENASGEKESLTVAATF